MGASALFSVQATILSTDVVSPMWAGLLWQGISREHCQKAWQFTPPDTWRVRIAQGMLCWRVDKHVGCFCVACPSPKYVL